MRRWLLFFTVFLMTYTPVFGQTAKDKLLLSHKAMQEYLMDNKEFDLNRWEDLSETIANDSIYSHFQAEYLDEVETNGRHVICWKLFLKDIANGSFDIESISKLDKKVYMVCRGEVIDTESDLQSLLHFYKQVKDQNVV